MTTLVGICAEKDGESVVLASDLNRTRISWVPRGDYAVREQTKVTGQKIYVDKAGKVAFAMSGVYDSGYKDFLTRVVEGEFDVIEHLSKGFFPELRSLNLSRWDGKIPNLEDSNSLLIAAIVDDKPRLYTCYPLGKIERRSWTSIGSGSDFALRYLNEQNVAIPHGIGLKEAIPLAVGSLEAAERDIYTGGLDICVVKGDGIRAFGNYIHQEMNSAKQRIIKNIIKKSS